MNVSHVKNVDAQLIRKCRRNESILFVAGKKACSPAFKTQEEVDCSTAVKEIREAKIEVSKVPAVRNERVLEIKGRVERGLYNISGEQLACKMMRESITHLFGLDFRVKNYVVRHFLYEPGSNTADKSPMRDGLIPICFNRTFSVLITNKK